MIALDEKSFGSESPEVGTDLNNLGLLYFFLKRYDESQKVFQRALSIRRKAFGDEDIAVAETMASYSSVLRSLHRNDEAKQMDDKAREIFERHNAATHH